MTAECRHVLNYTVDDLVAVCRYCGKRFEIILSRKRGRNA